MTVILYPANLTVLSDDTVLHIIQIILTLADLIADAAFHGLQIIRMHQAGEGVAR